MVKDIAKSLGITFVVSASIAFFLTNWNINFWTTFLLGTVIQITVWNLYDRAMQVKIALRTKEIDEEILKDFAMQSVPIKCCYCETVNLAPIRLDDNNQFSCDQCNKNNAIYIDIEAGKITNSIDLERTIKVNENV